MTTRIAAFIIAAAWLIGACTTVDDIQKQRVLMQLTYAGSTEAMSECVQQRLRARLHTDASGRHVLYEAVKSQGSEGLSHYSITLSPRPGQPGGTAAWRVMAPPSSGRFGPNTVTESAVRTYWTPVEECAKRTKPAPKPSAWLRSP